MIFDLPTSLDVAGKKYNIRTDFRDILKILIAFGDPELANNEKQYVCLFILYEEYDDIPPEHYDNAFTEALRFIDNGMEGEKNSPRTMDWEQDAPILFPAVNRVAGRETRAMGYLHWWTFMGFFMEIKDSIYSSVLNIRQKKAKGKKLEKWEREFWKNNKKLCVLEEKLTEEEREEKERLNDLFR